ncbi:MAG: type II toxin-antitoxin system VapB family antitoxin [Terracidiphilus sp.]
MRTNIDIDDRLMRAAMKATGTRTKRAAVEAALRRLVELRAEEAQRRELIRRRRGTGAPAFDDDWLEKWLASGWDLIAGQRRQVVAEGDKG